MKVYVDFDDVLCETGMYFSILVKEMFGKNIPYDKIRNFILKESFGLTDEENKRMMEFAHRSDQLASYEETPGAAETVRKWIRAGHEVFVVTGRPYSTKAASEEWLANHGLSGIPVVHVDKYNREGPSCSGSGDRALTVSEFSSLRFDFAVEDSPSGIEHLKLLENCTVAVFDRPWNQECILEDGFFRCSGWNQISALFDELDASLRK